MEIKPEDNVAYVSDVGQYESDIHFADEGVLQKTTCVIPPEMLASVSNLAHSFHCIYDERTDLFYVLNWQSRFPGDELYLECFRVLALRVFWRSVDGTTCTGLFRLINDKLVPPGRIKTKGDQCDLVLQVGALPGTLFLSARGENVHLIR